MKSTTLEPFWMGAVLLLVGVALILVGRTFESVVEARAIGLGILGASVVELVYRWRRRVLDENEAQRLLAAVVGVAATGLKNVWLRRIEATPDIEVAVLNERHAIIVHDSLFFTIETAWQRIISDALARGLHVTLVHAKFGTQAFANRYAVVSPKKGKPQDIDVEWREPLKKQYPTRFVCIPTEQLFSGPFILVGRRQLFLGMWVPGMSSEHLPLTLYHLEGSVGKSIAGPLFTWLRELKALE